MKGIDYSFARPDPAAIKAAGFEFVLRYVPYQGDGGKGLTVDEIAALQAEQLAIGLVFESVGERHLEGFDAGKADGLTSLNALTRLRIPSTVPVYFAVDFDAQPNQMAAIDAYQRGAAWVLGPNVGVYGSYDVIKHCFANETAAWFWQTYAWSRGIKFPGIHLYQYSNGETVGGAAVDFDEAYGDEQGLWKVGDDLTQAEKDELKALRVIVGGPAADGHDLLASINNLNASLTEHLASHGGAAAASGAIAPHKHSGGETGDVK